jgi:transcriptional regulator with XRE-family HTH domain
MTTAHDLEDYFRATMRSQRKELGMSQQMLCDKLAEAGIILDTSAVTRLEIGKRIIRLGEAMQIADILDFPLQPTRTRALDAAARRIHAMSEKLSQLAETLVPDATCSSPVR